MSLRNNDDYYDVVGNIYVHIYKSVYSDEMLKRKNMQKENHAEIFLSEPWKRVKSEKYEDSR